MTDTLAEAAVLVLTCADAQAKAATSVWRDRRITEIGRADPPDRPGRPEKPELRLPRDMPKRRKAQSLGGRIALLVAERLAAAPPDLATAAPPSSPSP